MTVYVDDMHMPATVGRYRARWSHMFSDAPDLAELHALAARIGLRRSWFQDKPSGAHYDVTDSRRAAAIRAGAVPVSWRELADVWPRAVRAQQRAAGSGHDEHRPGGNLRQDVTTGPVLPHHEATGENAMVEPNGAGVVR